jgi:hypothetical protein
VKSSALLAVQAGGSAVPVRRFSLSRLVLRGPLLAAFVGLVALAIAATPAAAEPPTNLGGPHTPVNSSEVIVRGWVNPKGLSLSDCHFEWGATPAHGQTVPCEASIPSDSEEHLVSARIKGLSPTTTYHAVLVVSNVDGTDTGEDFPFRTLAAPAPLSCANGDSLGAGQLPDCRAWEMVSPLDKNGGEVLRDSSRTQAAVGETLGLPMAVGFASLSGFGDVAGSSIATDYLAQRSTDPDPGNQGWTTHAVLPVQPQQTYLAGIAGTEGHYELFNADLTLGDLSFPAAVRTVDGPHPNVDLLANQYRRDDPRTPGAGIYRLLSDAPTTIQTEERGLGGLFKNIQASSSFSGASADFQHILFRSGAPHTADAPSSGVSIYEWENGVERLVSRVPGSGASCDDSGGVPCEPASDASIGEGPIQPAYVHDVISRDGERVFFKGHCSAGPCGLYERIAHHETVRIDVSERTDCAEDPTCGGDGVPDSVSDPMAPGSGVFWDASADGTRAFFTTSDALTDDASADGRPKLYMYDATKAPTAPDNLTFISKGGGEVEGVLGASQDGTAVYFADLYSLLPDVHQGQHNIFLWRDGSPGLSYVGTVPGVSVRYDTPGQVAFSPLESRVSPDGSRLLFASGSGQGLTGYDQGPCETQGPEADCQELYVYDRDASSRTSAQLICVSCNPTGAPAVSEASVHVRDSTGGATTTQRITSALSSDGHYAFFSSGDPLVASDTNGRSDAYEFDLTTGQVHLLSSGESPGDSFFLEASGDGHDVFFATREALSGWDQATANDLYDARIGGGFPEPPPLAASCQGDACQPPPVALNDPTPASAAFKGAGNKVGKCKRQKTSKKAQKKSRKAACRKKHHRKHHRNTANHKQGADR